MSDTPAVPDTEAEREALAWLSRCDIAPGDLDTWLEASPQTRAYAATVVRAALARDAAVPDPDGTLIEAINSAASRHTEDARMGPDDVRCASCSEESWPCLTATALDQARAALARDVPAGRDLTADDVWHGVQEVNAGGKEEYVADVLNRIARPAGVGVEDPSESASQLQAAPEVGETAGQDEPRGPNGAVSDP